MTELATIERPLISGPTLKLESLFAHWTYVEVATDPCRRYPAPDGYYLFHGLPGSLRTDCALFVKPHEAARLAAESRLANGVIGSFRCVRSARFMKDDLLPVFVTDPQHFARPLLALVAYDEHDRFERMAELVNPLASPVKSLPREARNVKISRSVRYASVSQTGTKFLYEEKQ